jgi:rare lipoprotein A
MRRKNLQRAGRWAVVLMAGASLAACASLTTPQYAIHDGPGARHAPPSGAAGATGTNAPYQVGGIWYVPHEQPNYDETGIASWYGDAFQLKATADGEIFDMNQFSAAHTTLPLPSLVEVTNLDNGRKLVVRVNDRGPFVGGRIIDLSHAAARELGYDRAGTAHVRVKYVGPAPLAGPDAGVRVASNASFSPKYPIARPAAAAAAPPIQVASRPAPGASAAPADDGGVQLTSFRSPEAVGVTALPALAAARAATAPVERDSPAPAIPAETAASAPQVFRIQAGAFSDQGNARRAAAQLASAGVATVEPIERNGVTLWRVLLPGPADEAEAYAFRDKVAAIGFTDARVVRPF